MPSINQFRHRVVRDLAWVIASPPLISGLKQSVTQNSTLWLDHVFCINEFEACFSALLQLDKNPHPLIKQLEALKSKRLGYRFEAFINYWLQISPNFTLIDHNIQIIENKQTLGEVDFIIQDKHSKAIIHLEVAVKFYLGTAPYEDDFRWFGTNTNDQLGKKQQHLTKHQTQLSLKYPKHFSYNIDQRYCLLKGRLFYPLNTKSSSPKSATENHLKAYWIQQGQTTWDEFLNKTQVFSLEKHQWLATMQAADIKNKALLIKPLSLERPQCCISLNNKKEEDKRIFILPASFRFPTIEGK
jgi:hypothetical protein